MDIGFFSAKNLDSNSIFHEGAENKSRLGKFFEKSILARRILLFIAMLGMCMLIGDGILTPAISGLPPWLFSYSFSFVVQHFAFGRNIYLNKLIWRLIFCQYYQLWMASEHLFLLSVNVSIDANCYNLVIILRILQKSIIMSRTQLRYGIFCDWLCYSHFVGSLVALKVLFGWITLSFYLIFVSCDAKLIVQLFFEVKWPWMILFSFF